MNPLHMVQDKNNEIKEFRKPRIIALYTVIKEKDSKDYNKSKLADKTHDCIEEIGAEELGIDGYSVPNLHKDIKKMEGERIIKRKDEREDTESHKMKINFEKQTIVENWDRYEQIRDKVSDFLNPSKDLERKIADEEISKLWEIDEDNIEKLTQDVVASVSVNLEKKIKKLQIDPLLKIMSDID